MIKWNIPLKVAVGYVVLVLVVCLASWLVYGNMTSLMRINDEEQLLAERRSVADSLIYSFLDVDNKGHSIMFGLTRNMDDFDLSLQNALAIAKRLGEMTSDTAQKLRIDTLEILLLQKRNNTMLMLRVLEDNTMGEYYQNRISDFQDGKDSMMVHTQSAETTRSNETVYEVVKSKKGFFPRLGDAFRRQHTDTMVTRRDSNNIVVDSVMHNINISDSVADVLSDIQIVEEKLKKQGLDRLTARQKSLQLVSVNLASRIELLLYDIRQGEQYSFRDAVNADIAERHETMMRVLSLAVISLILTVILLIYVWRDSRKERRFIESLENANAETKRVMQQRERLLLTITHDIKAPAASISGFTELMKEHTSNQKLISYLSSIRSSSLHLLHLIKELLDYHCLEDGKMEVQSINFSARKLVGGCVAEMLPQANTKGIVLTCDIDECGDMLLRGDALRISQILENLVSNALKYTSEGSVTVTAFVRGGKLCMNVADTGQGMTKKESERIYDAFTRLQGAQGIEGVGLGLSITKELVELLGGRIHLSTEKGKGTEFRVVIPIEVTDVKDIPEDPKEEPIAKTFILLSDEKKEILVIDDDKLQLRLLSEMFHRLIRGKWNITACQQVDEGLSLLNNKHFDVLITDIEMPAMSGKELIGKFDHEGIVVIGMTAHERDIEPSLLSSGFDACLFKPFTIRELADVLSKVNDVEIKVVDELPQSVTDDENKITHEANEQVVNTDSFAALTAFACGDEEAEREILSCFKSDLERNAAMLRNAIISNDRDEIARVAHKSLPSMAMVSKETAEILKRLSPNEIANVGDDELRKSVEAVIMAMEKLIVELTV